MSKEAVKVVFAAWQGNSLSAPWREKIAALSSRIKLEDISALLEAAKQGDADARKRVNVLLGEAEICFGLPFGLSKESILAHAPKLKWIQSPVNGVDAILTPDIIASPLIVTRASIHATQVSEAALCMMLMLARNAPELFHFQQQQKWQKLYPTVLNGKTVGILGMGGIGQSVARLTKAFGMRVMATRSNPEIRNRNVDVMLPASQLGELLAQSDFVVIVLPFTEQTRNLIDEAALRTMKPSAYLINVGRGGIVDEDALARALSERWIAGAALDVFNSDPQPLPPDSKLWGLPNLIITPHNAGSRKDYGELLMQLFYQNLKRYLSEKELIGVVDKQRGY